MKGKCVRGTTMYVTFYAKAQLLFNGRSPGLRHLQAPSRVTGGFCLQGMRIFSAGVPHTVARQRRILTGFPILPSIRKDTISFC